MWKIKRFKSFSEQADWIRKNEERFSITVLFVNNGYAVEYKKLKVIKF